MEDIERPNKVNIMNQDQERRAPLLHIQMEKPCFGVSKKELVSVMDEYQLRKTAEEIDYLATLGGPSSLEKGMLTDFAQGISNTQGELDMRINRYGHNRRPERPVKSFCEFLWIALEDFTLRVLIVAAVVSMTLQTAVAEPKDRSHAWIEGFAILIAVAVCSLVAAVNDYQRELQFQQLNKVADHKKLYSVKREGELMELHHSDLMVGDLVVLREGMDIPVDALLLSSCEVFTDESAMTGETEPVRKDEYQVCAARLADLRQEKGRVEVGQHEVPSCVLMGGTKVLTGEGTFVVLVVGDASCEGKIRAKLTEEENVSTPLQQKLEAIANDIGTAGLYSAIVIVGALLIRFTIERVMAGSFESSNLVEILNFLIIGVTVVVVAIPEGLPLSVTLSLAFSVKRMLKDQNLVRKIQSCETMGGANMICSDKTGTLTQNKMTLQCIWNQQTTTVDASRRSFDLAAMVPSSLMREVFTQMTVFNQSAQLRPTPKGNKTEIAVLEFLEKAGVNLEQALSSQSVVQKMPFNSKRKRMSVVLGLGEERRLVIKGAPEYILDSCSHFQSFSGERLVMDSTLQRQIKDSVDDLASKALRCLVYAYKDISGREDTSRQNSEGVFEVEQSGLTLVAVIGIRDIPRPEVPKAISDCKKAGIKVRMVTGDNKLTAKAIALECGIVDKQDSQALVMDGVEFIKRVGGVVCKACRTQECPCGKEDDKNKRVDTIANAQEFDKLYPNLCVMSRSRPEDKYALVTGLMERGHVVAVTGDGTNDAPALKKADVGFAMGVAGTEVAREAAEIILMDDNFSSIVKAVMWGRNIYDNIKKFLQFQLTVNVVAVVSTLIGAVVLKQEVMTPIQMLWINLIMDSLASLALATESPTQALLERPPHTKNEYMVTRNMFKHIIGQSIYQLVVLMVICFCGDQFVPEVKDELDTYLQARLAAQDPTFVHLHGMHMKYSDQAQSLVRSGRLKTMLDSTNLFPSLGKQFQGQDYQPVQALLGPSRHFTFLFNTFVWMTIFNFLNARVLNDKLNILEGVFRNPLFSLIVGVIAVMQVLLITFGGIPFSCYYWAPFYGLHWSQWLYCLLFSLGGLVWSVLLKMIPDSLLGGANFGSKSQDPIRRQSSVLGLKRQHSRLENLSLNRP